MQAAGEHAGGAGPRESMSEQECGPKRAQAWAMGGKGESMQMGSGREGVETRVLERTCGGGGVGQA